ncbi:MAG TPA: hypothetical protein DCR48_05045 [Flavobacteriales bacterium]|nr:hypothetical protein [Flavobacteriales bacterium]
MPVHGVLYFHFRSGPHNIKCSFCKTSRKVAANRRTL